jgi:hypothetical protein
MISFSGNIVNWVTSLKKVKCNFDMAPVLQCFNRKKQPLRSQDAKGKSIQESENFITIPYEKIIIVMSVFSDARI